jgi:hypothetical protein
MCLFLIVHPPLSISICFWMKSDPNPFCLWMKVVHIHLLRRLWIYRCWLYVVISSRLLVTSNRLSALAPWLFSVTGCCLLQCWSLQCWPIPACKMPSSVIKILARTLHYWSKLNWICSGIPDQIQFFRFKIDICVTCTLYLTTNCPVNVIYATIKSYIVHCNGWNHKVYLTCYESWLVWENPHSLVLREYMIRDI